MTSMQLELVLISSFSLSSIIHTTDVFYAHTHIRSDGFFRKKGPSAEKTSRRSCASYRSRRSRKAVGISITVEDGCA